MEMVFMHPVQRVLGTQLCLVLFGVFWCMIRSTSGDFAGLEWCDTGAKGSE